MAVSNLADSSMKTLQRPSACPMTGIRVLFWIFRTRALLPLGITRSMYRSKERRDETSSLVCTVWMYVSGREVDASARWITADRRVAVFLDSLPPLRIAAFPDDPYYRFLPTSRAGQSVPDFIAKVAMLTTTSGRASKMTRSTPIGQVILYNSRSSSNSLAYVMFPVGSSRLDTSETPWSIASHLSPLARSSRLTREADNRPAATSFCASYTQDSIADLMTGGLRRVTSISFLFASKICDLFASSCFVMARRAFVRSDEGRSWEASNASFAARAIDSVSPMRLSRLMTPSERQYVICV